MTQSQQTPRLDEIRDLDRDDPLAAFRAKFVIPDNTIYLDGNSLGAMPQAAAEIGRRTIEREWSQGLVTSWNAAGWYELPRRLGGKIAGLIGAAPGEVVMTDTTGIDLFKAVASALALRPDRRFIVMEGSNFPTNNYVVQGLVQLLGDNHQIRFAEAAEINDAIQDDVAVVCLTHVHYKYGHVHDMREITSRAHAAGALSVWDLCHSVGALPVDLNGSGADFAVGCTYKFLNGGPGAPAFLFTARRHHNQAIQPLTGWWSHAEPFAFKRDYRPAAGIARMLSGTQPILSMAVAEAGIDVALQAPIETVRDKSMRLGDLFLALIGETCIEFDLEVACPRDARSRGSQVALAHPHAYSIMQALIDRGVIGDFRAPDVMRFGLTPLYLRYEDVWQAVQVLREVMETEAWRRPDYAERLAVT
ncbi:MAG: kynureninase [Gammaproteobacteria bacterium]|nr:kynureninase [Gammaproteobacteria bacterium]